jgi:hypothetical protein
LADKHFRPLPRPGHSRRRPFPDWVEYKPNSIWIYDTTHFTRAKMAVLIIQDLVSRKWITEVVSAEETSTQVEIGFTDALQAEGLLEVAEPPCQPTKDRTVTPFCRPRTKPVPNAFLNSAGCLQEVYDRYMKYLTGCAKLFRQGQVDVNQFTLKK